jgi:hypothetical protein
LKYTLKLEKKLSQQGIYLATNKAVKNAFGANSLVTLLLSKKNISSNAQHPLKIIPYRRVQYREEMGRLPTYDFYVRKAYLMHFTCRC